MAPLVAGQDAEAVLQQAVDQLAELFGTFGKPVEDNHRAGRCLRVIPEGGDRLILRAADGQEDTALPQTGQHQPVHGFRIAFGIYKAFGGNASSHIQVLRRIDLKDRGNDPAGSL